MNPSEESEITIVIDDAIPYVKGVMEPYCRVRYIDGRSITSRDVADADALMVRTRTKCDAALLEGSRVQVIATATIGYDHIDMVYCRKRRIAVFSAAGCNARGVLQWLGAALVNASARQVWEPAQKTIGVVGTGNVGSLSARYGRMWGFNVLCCDPLREKKRLPSPTGEAYVDLEQIARQSDIITFHTPLTYKGSHPTYHMAGKDFFSHIKQGALILNASRGEVVDTDAFREAISAGRCEGIVDTWEHEPDIDRQFLDATMLATPHIAGYTAQGKANASAMAVACLSSFFGFPLINWYPYDAMERITPRDISWDELKATVSKYFDIVAESGGLKSHPADFEAIRTSYPYRQEYF